MRSSCFLIGFSHRETRRDKRRLYLLNLKCCEKLSSLFVFIKCSFINIFTNQSPLRSLKNANCQRFTERLDKAVARNAESAAMIRIFFLPYVSLKNPHKCDVKIMPVSKKQKDVHLEIDKSHEMLCSRLKLRNRNHLRTRFRLLFHIVALKLC